MMSEKHGLSFKFTEVQWNHHLGILLLSPANVSSEWWSLLQSSFSSAYFQQKLHRPIYRKQEKLQREIYSKPCKEFELNDDKILKLLKNLYRLSKSGDYWEQTFCKHLWTAMYTETCISNAALFYTTDKQRLCDTCHIYNEDTLHAGKVRYAYFWKENELRFKCKDRIWDKPQYKRLQEETKERFSVINQQL